MIPRGLALWLAPTAPARATVEASPALHDVTGVETADLLDICAETRGREFDVLLFFSGAGNAQLFSGCCSISR